MDVKGRRFIAKTLAIPFLLGVGTLGGCGTTVAPPVREISNTEMTINQARESEAVKYAPLELRLAEDNLNAAKAAVKNEEYEKAQKLADKALADANLAMAKTNAAKAKEFAAELQDSIKSLQDEIKHMQKKSH